MKNIDVLREIVCSMNDLSPRNEALKIAMLAILDKLQRCEKVLPYKDEAKPKKEPGPVPEPQQKKEPAKRRGRKPFDIGKAKACRAAGWSITKIADEMGVTDQTVRNNLKKAGVDPGATIAGSERIV